MNATVVWSILAFLVGGTAGFVAGVKFGKKDYVRRIDDLTDENEWLSTKAHDYSVKNDILIEKMEKFVDEPLQDLRRADRRTMVELSQKYKDPDFDEHFAEREGPSDDEPFRPPFEITEAEFNDDFAFSDSSCVSYYQDDGVLADERDEPFDFPNEILGKNIIDMLDVGDCPDHVYVHNDWTDTNYDVTLERGMNFCKDILGDMGEEEE